MSSEFVGALRQDVCTRCEARRSGDGEGVFLVITCSLVKPRELYPCVGAPTWIRGERHSSIPRKKIWLSRVSYFYFKQLNPFVVVLDFDCL